MSLQAKLIIALIALVALIGSHWYVYDAGDRNGTNAVLVKTLQASTNALNQRLADNAKQAQQQAAAAQQETIQHENELAQVRAALRAAQSRRVPIDRAAFCRPAGAAETGATRSNGQGNTGPAFLPDAFANDLRQLAADADEVTADLRTLKGRVEQAKCFE
jgi:DNA-binding protein H-NS